MRAPPWWPHARPRTPTWSQPHGLQPSEHARLISDRGPEREGGQAAARDPSGRPGRAVGAPRKHLDHARARGTLLPRDRGAPPAHATRRRKHPFPCPPQTRSGARRPRDRAPLYGRSRGDGPADRRPRAARGPRADQASCSPLRRLPLDRSRVRPRAGTPVEGVAPGSAAAATRPACPGPPHPTTPIEESTGLAGPTPAALPIQEAVNPPSPPEASDEVAGPVLLSDPVDTVDVPGATEPAEPAAALPSS